MNRIALLSFCLIAVIKINAQMPVASSGIIKRHENLQSKFITARNVDVLLPEGYTSKKKYNVLYMHDGQMLFDSTTTWNHQAWEIEFRNSFLSKANIIMGFSGERIWLKK